MDTYLGIDIGGTKSAVVLGERTRPEDIASLAPTDRIAFPTETQEGLEACLRRIFAAADQLLSRNRGRGGGLSGIGVSCGGPLDSARGIVLCPTFLPGWVDVPIVELLQQRYGVRARLQNDANACALAEWRHGAGVGTRNMIFLTFGTGMGAGLILDGRLYEGTNDLGGEVGHLRLAEDGPRGYGKAGSFEGFCSGGGIALLARAEAEKALAAGRAVSFCADRAALESITSRDVGDAAEAGDPLAREVLAVSGRFLGRGLAMLIDVLNPECIVIGSIFVRCRRFLQAAMDEEIAREALPGAARACTVVPARLGDSIGDYACLSVAVDGLEKESQ